MGWNSIENKQKMRDFTLDVHIRLLATLQERGYSFYTVKDSVLKRDGSKRIILRHDVDLLPKNSLRLAEIQHQTGIYGTYYFRIIPESFNDSLIRDIALMGHEIGYHYETMDTCNGNVVMAYDEFCRNLEMFRKIVPVETVCMHGSPLSKFDNRAIWERFDYKNLGIIAEPYFDIDFNKVCYITDTGRMWDGDSFNFRDKGSGNWQQAIGEENRMPRTANLKPFSKFHTTFDIIRAAEEDRLPDKIMMTFHPQRWTDKPVPWVREFIWQNVKNVGKYFLVKLRDKEEVGSRK